MATNFDDQNPTSKIYKSSGGYIPGIPDSTWYGVPKELFEKVVTVTTNETAVYTSFIDPDGTQYNGNHALQNKGTAEPPPTITTAVLGPDGEPMYTEKKLVSLDEAGTGFVVNQDIEPIFTCKSRGWGELYAGYGGSPDLYGTTTEQLAEAGLADISAEVNPTTTAAKRALVNASMAMYASEEFYVYMLSKGYVYKDVPSYATEPPINWVESVRQEIEEEFDVPSAIIDNVEQLVIVDKPITDGFGNPDTVPEGETIIRDVLLPEKHPAYGTKYDPSSQSALATQEGYYEKLEQGVLQSVGGFQPQDFPSQKAPWAQTWKAVWTEDISIGVNQEEFNNDNSSANLEAPVYAGEIKIHAEQFIVNFLEPKGLVEHHNGKALIAYNEFINTLPKFNPETGETITNAPPLLIIPGSAKSKPLQNFVDMEGEPEVDIFAFAKLDQIAKNLQTNIAEFEPDKKEPFEIGQIFPGSTHYANNLAIDKVLNGDFDERQFYASFLQQNKIKILKKPIESSNSEDVATVLEIGETVKVFEEYIARGKGKYHRVQITNPASKYYQSKTPLFVRACNLSKLANQPPSLKRVYKEYQSAEKPVNWTKMDDETIFFDNYHKAYSIVVEPIDPTTGQKITSLGNKDCPIKVQDLEPIAVRHGLEAMLKCHNKAPLFENDEDLTKTLDFITSGVFQTAYSKSKTVFTNQPNWYLGTRPESKLRMIVRMPAKYFDALLENSVLTNQIFAPKAITLLTCNLEHKIAKAIEVMRVHKQQIDRFSGTIEFLNLDKEIQRLKKFPLTLEKFIEENNVKYNRAAEDEIEIGIVPNNYSVLYVEYSTAGMPIRMRKCFNKFIKSDPIRFSRTIAYISFLDEIIELGKPNTSQSNGWITLAEQYTYPTPIIKSAAPVSVGEIISKKTPDELAAKLDLLDVLTSVGKFSQDKEISIPELKLRFASMRLKQRDFIGDPFVGSIPDLLDLIGDLPRNKTGLLELFSLVFDKIDIPTLGSIGSSSLMKDMPFANMEASFALASLDSPDFGELSLGKLFSSLPSPLQGKIELAEGFLNGDIDIDGLEGFSDSVVDQLLDYFDINLQIPSNEKQQPANDTKYTTMPVEDAKCLSEKNPQQFPAEKNTLTKDSSKRLDLIKIIASGEELLGAVKEAVPEIFDAVSAIGSADSIDMPTPGGLSLTIPAVKMPKPPTLSLPSLKIDDTMPGITQDLTSSLEEILATVFIELTSGLLESVYDSIFSTSLDVGQNGTDGPSIDFGGQDINDIIQDGVTDLFSSVGIPLPIIKENPPKEVVTKVSEVITPLEAFDLLEGRARKETIDAVEQKINEINPKMLQAINTNSSTSDLFRGMGKLADPSTLETARAALTQILPNVTGLLCEDEKETFIGREGITSSRSARETVLAEKLDDECINTQLNDQERINKEKLAELLSYAQGANILDGKIPNPIYKCGIAAKSDPSGGSIPTSGIINKNHETVDYLNKKIVKAIFDPIKMNFSEEANSIMSIYSEQEFRNPFEGEEQYELIKQQLDINSFEGDFAKGLLGELDSNLQSQFDQIAAPLRRLDIQVAPKIKKLLSSRTALTYEQESLSPALQNKGLKIVPSATGSVKSENFEALETAQRELSSLKQTAQTLKNKINFIESNPSSPFSIDFDNIKKEFDELSGVGGLITIAENNVKVANEAFDDIAETVAAGALPGATPQPQEYPFYYFSKKYPENLSSENFTLSDTWTFVVPQSTARGLINIDTRTTNTDPNFSMLSDISTKDTAQLSKIAANSLLDVQEIPMGIQKEQCEDDPSEPTFSIMPVGTLPPVTGRDTGEDTSEPTFSTMPVGQGASEPTFSTMPVGGNNSSFNPQGDALGGALDVIGTIGGNNVIIQGSSDIDPAISEMVENFVFFPNFTERDQVFANLFKEKWESVNSNMNVDYDSVAGQKFFTFFRNKRPLYFSALVNMLGAQITQSKLFDINNFANLEFGESMQLKKDLCDNLLVLEDLKDSANKQYDNTCDDNQSSSKPGAIEEANIANLIKASIRTIIIQLVSKSIFLFSQYSFEKCLKDSALIQFVVEFVIHDLQKQGEEYYVETMKYNEEYLVKRREKGETLVDPFSDSSDTDPMLEGQAIAPITYLQYTIKEELKKLAPLIDKKINPPTDELEDIFLNNVVPNIDVAYHKDQNRFQTIVPLEVNEEGEESITTKAEARKQFSFLDPKDPLFNNSGGFVLERYIRIEDSDLVLENNDFLNEKEKAFGELWFNREGGRDNKEIDATISESIVFGEEPPTPESFSYTSGAVNKTALIQKISSIMEQTGLEVDDVNFAKFVKNFKFGIRLVYIPPASGDKYQAGTEAATGWFDVAKKSNSEKTLLFDDAALEDLKAQAADTLSDIEQITDFETVYNESISTPAFPEIKEEVVDAVARREKLYKINETVGSIEPDEQNEGVATIIGNSVDLYPVALIEIEEDMGFFEAVSGNSNQAPLAPLLLGLESQFIDNIIFTALKKKLVKSKKFKLLFDYDIPLKRVMTLLFTHNVIGAAKNYPELSKSYDQTKELIRANFFNMIPGDPWWSKQDKEIEEAGGNAGLMADANNSMTSTGPSGSAIAAKIAFKAALILVKAYAEKTDPHYGLMKKLDDFGLTIDGMTWKSVPALYPVNFPPLFGLPGWGPPMTPTGMLAYSLPLLPGEIKKKKKKQKEEGKSTDDSSCKDE